MSRKSNNSQSQEPLYRGAGDWIAHGAKDLSPQALNSACKIPDADEGRAKLIDLETNAFEAKAARERAVVTGKRDHYATVAREKEALRADTSAELAKTPQSIRTAQLDADGHAIQVPMAKWQGRDLVEFYLLTGILTAGVAASLLTAQASLIGSGNPVFLEQIYLSWVMAFLAPLTSFALKTLGTRIRHAGLRAAYIFVLGTAMTISASIWVVTFSLSYKGLGTTIDIGSIFEGPTLAATTRDTLHAIVTLTTEILATAVIALRISEIAGRYSADHDTANPRFAELTKRLAVLEAEILAAIAERDAAQGILDECDKSLAARNALVTIAYDARRGERNDPIL